MDGRKKSEFIQPMGVTFCSLLHLNLSVEQVVIHQTGKKCWRDAINSENYNFTHCRNIKRSLVYQQKIKRSDVKKGTEKSHQKAETDLYHSCN